MKRIAYAAAIVALYVTAVSAAEVGSQTRTVQLSKMILDPEIPAANQRVKVGTICLFSGQPLNFGSAERTLDYERFERLFAATLSERRFNVIAKSSNLFEDEASGPSPDFLIGGTIRPQSVDICDSVNGQKGSIAISVEWQIYDRSRHEVVETATTQGTGRVERFHSNGVNVMFDQAFSASLSALVEQGVLQRHLGNPAS